MSNRLLTQQSKAVNRGSSTQIRVPLERKQPIKKLQAHLLGARHDAADLVHRSTVIAEQQNSEPKHPMPFTIEAVTTRRLRYLSVPLTVPYNWIPRNEVGFAQGGRDYRRLVAARPVPLFAPKWSEGRLPGWHVGWLFCQFAAKPARELRVRITHL